MKKKLFLFAAIGAAIVGFVGCQSAKNKSSEPLEQADDVEEEAKEREETAKQDEDGTGSRNDAPEEEVVEEEFSEDRLENFVTYYGCPNSKRIAKLNTKKNRIRI